MKTDDLIDVLARGEGAPALQNAWPRVAVALAAGLLLGAGLLLTFFGGMRPDIGTAHMAVMMKAGFAAMAAAVSLPLLMRLSRPGRAVGWRVPAILGFVAISAAVTSVALLRGDPAQRLTLWIGDTFPHCILIIPLLAAPTAMLLGRLLRDFAPTRLTLTGAAVGAVSGGIGAMAYAMHCPVGSVAFVATWYSVAIAFCALAGAAAGERLLRW